MTKISTIPTYSIKENISPNDYFVGTNSETDQLETVNFLFNNVRNFLIAGLSPEIGGTLKINEITYTGGLYSTPAAFVNSLDPNYTVSQYHIVIVSINGFKYILKPQNIILGLNQNPITNGDFITFPVSVGPQGIPGNNGTNGSDGAQGIQGEVGPQGIQGIAGTNGTNGTNGVDASNNLQRDATSSFTLSDSDNNYVIQLKNSTTAITITIPSTGLRDKFNVGFKLKGSGDVTFAGASGVTVINPIGFKGKGLGYSTYIERDGNTQNYDLLGDTKV
jgi:Collagen triple helix repeat (20 copies)